MITDLLDQEQPSRIIIPTTKDIQDLLMHDTDWAPLNPIMVVEDLVKISDFEKGYILTRRLAANINGSYYDIPVCHKTSEKSLDRFYNIPLVSWNSTSTEAVFRLAFEMLCRAGKRRVFVRRPGEKAPYLIDANFDGAAVTHQFAPYLKSNVERISGGDKATGERFKRMIVDVLAEESSYAR
jgi:hypothetical protein